MRKTGSNRSVRSLVGRDATIELLHEIEPELRQLDGLLMMLTLLGEAQDSVEPLALASLSRAARAAFDTVDANWRVIFEEMRR